MNAPSGFITVTGADEQTDIAALSELDAEIGLLYSAMPEGRNRYPSWEWLVGAAKQIPRLSIHVCGSAARRQLASVQLEALISRARRVQVNGRVSITELESLCALYPNHTIITQYKTGNAELVELQLDNHAMLQDSSGGRGISASRWNAPPNLKAFGFAGGLGPENLPVELQRICAVASKGWWVDMEQSLRVDDMFSVERARAAVAAFHRTVRPNAHAA
jgi:phosphoribosylanthranilate isomerase